LQVPHTHATVGGVKVAAVDGERAGFAQAVFRRTASESRASR